MRATTTPAPLAQEDPCADLPARLQQWGRTLGPPLSEAVAPLLGQGKLIRPRLVYAVGGTGSSVDRAAEAVELIHVASLVHDDLLDSAPLRRGVPTVAAAHGAPLAQAAGDALFATAFLCITNARNVTAVRLLADASRSLVQGEWGQTQAREQRDITAAQYLDWCAGKTGALLGAALALGAVMAADARHEEWYAAGVLLGQSFQIDDDVLDCVGDPRRTGKPRGADIRNGVMTLPLIYALTDDPSRATALSAARGDAARAAALAKELAGTTAVTRARQQASDLRQQGAARLRQLANRHQRRALQRVVAQLEDRRA